MNEFLPRHLKEKHGRPASAAEFLYSLVYTCSKHLYCPHLNLFLKVLLGEVEDTLRDEHQELLGQLAAALSSHESKVNTLLSGWVAKADFKTLTLQVLKCSTDQPLLWASLEVDEEQGLVCYDELLEPDASGMTSAFMDSLLDTLIETRLNFFYKLEDSVHAFGQPHVTPRVLADAVESLQEPHQAGVLGLVSRVFAGREVSAADQAAVSCSLEEVLRVVRVRRIVSESALEASTLLTTGEKKAKKKSKEIKEKKK